MARANREAIETFTSITGASEAVAVQRLEEQDGDINEAVNAHFSEGDRNITQQAPVDDFMDIDDPIGLETRGPLQFLSAARNLNPFSIIGPTFPRSSFEGRAAPEFSSHAPYVSHPRVVREIPIEVKDGNDQPGHSGSSPTVEDVTGTAYAHGPEIRGHVIIDDAEDEGILIDRPAHTAGQNERETSFSGVSHYQAHVPSAPTVDSDDGNDIEEEMVRAAIEASKREAEEGYPNRQFGSTNDSFGPRIQRRQSQLEDTELAQAVSLSLKTAEKEKAHNEPGVLIGAAQQHDFSPSDVGESGKLPLANGRQGFGSLGKGTPSQLNLEAGSSSVQNEAVDVKEQPLVKHSSRHVSSGSVESARNVGEMIDSPPSSPRQHDIGTDQQRTGGIFHSDEWGGISSEEHDEAVMLEAALFGRIPEGAAYCFDAGSYPRRMPRPPSPTLAAQRLLREQQDDEYLASLQADRERELKAMEEAEARRLEQKAALAASLEEERRKEEEARMKLLEHEEFERQLASKEASLPREPASDDENAVTLLVRMPDGSRRGRRFLKSDKLQSLFDFIDVGRNVKPGTYKLVRPYPRRAFSDGESELSLRELASDHLLLLEEKELKELKIEADEPNLEELKIEVDEPNLEEVEEILDYKFSNKKLLLEAFVHPSFYSEKSSISYDRLEYIGDSVLNLLLARELFFLYPDKASGPLSKLRAANVDTEKLARVALQHNLHRYIRHKTPLLQQQIQDFSQAILDYPVHSNGLIDPPKVLADIVESIIAAVFIDSQSSLETVWQVFKGLLEPIISPETLGTHPVSELVEFCQKNSKGLKLRFADESSSENATINVFLGENLVGSAATSGIKKEIAQNRAAKAALDYLKSTSL
ncbi:hypothetical protein NE237_001543 [Protea cynaroides]|uniref:Uncharacterized protein n=1 Tax=Protea cynaroides TaxID=273540 RepID=A0A9Q0QYH1_9MAGN|nr:hypothetical protein NE237_001543 [Protea cynaroides]